ncbi:hypothetical protein F0562_029334 [Nyssa sinensis]|uniref:Uncharacterized protein n=1 Tax=Nyssa sinensis TaxID=561372 RepID=A0A5J5B3S5_9ASTE|nr:hypothetical protein F0562_029334 [Nyssa sinensis]
MKMDVYAVVSIDADSKTKQKTHVDKDAGTSPRWNHHMKFSIEEAFLAQQSDLSLLIQLKSDRSFRDKDIGHVSIPLRELLRDDGNGTDDNFERVVNYQVKTPSGKAKGTIKFSYKFGEKFSSQVAVNKSATTSKQAWSTLQKKFQRDSKVIVVKLQSLRRDFETLYMKSGESITDFLSQVTTIVSQMRSYGKKISDETVVAKVLRSLTPKFDHVVVVIEESKDLSVFSFDELMGSFQAHETRINRSPEKNEENAFQVKDIVTKVAESDSSTSRGCGRGGFRGRGRCNGRGRGRFDRQRQSGEQRNNKNGVQCYHCKKYGHIKVDCWYKEQQVNYAAENGKESSKLFMTYFDPNNKSSDVWFVDNGCSNHMTGMKSLFKELDETHKLKVQLRSAKEMQVEGKCTVGITTTHDVGEMAGDMFSGVGEMAENMFSSAEDMAGDVVQCVKEMPAGVGEMAGEIEQAQ